MIWERGFDPGVFGRFDLAALAQPHLKFWFVCLFHYLQPNGVFGRFDSAAL
jgi:hypothetical protein